MANIMQQVGRAPKSLQNKTNDFFELLVGEAGPSNEFLSLQGLVVGLNRGCDQIFRISGVLLQTTANFIGGEPNQNAHTRGEGPNVE